MLDLKEDLSGDKKNFIHKIREVLIKVNLLEVDTPRLSKFNFGKGRRVYLMDVHWKKNEKNHIFFRISTTEEGAKVSFDDDAAGDFDIRSHHKNIISLFDEIDSKLGILNIYDVMKHINETGYSDPTAPAEFRLNYFKNFNHFNKDQEGAMEIFGPRSNNEIARMGDEIFGDEENEDEENEIENSEIELSDEMIGDFDIEYPEDINPDGLTINSDEETIPRQHSYPYGFGTPPSPTYRMGGGVESRTGSPMLTFEQFEKLHWGGDIFGVELGELAVHQDEYFKMELIDVDYQDGHELLRVHFSEVNSPELNGDGLFIYTPSKIEGLSGDLSPVKMSGILREVFDDDPEIIYDFLQQLKDQITPNS